MWIGLYLEVAALLCFVVFAAFLRTLAHPFAPPVQWPASIAYGAALIFVILQLVSMASLGIVSYRAGTGADVASATVLLDLRLGSYILSWAAGALWLGFVAVSAFHTGTISRALSVSGVLIASIWLATCLLPTSDIAQFWGFVPLLWTAVASVDILRRSGHQRELSNARVLSSGPLS